MYDLRVDERVERELRRIPANIRDKLRIKMKRLANNPRPYGCIKLSDEEGYRIRQGDYRVLYEIDDAEKIVKIYRAGHRSDVYRR